MKKKLRNYIKFSLYALLVLGASIVSHAALTDADDSAYITKAEFDSIVSDFNNRIVNFELNVNANIDTLVTSYLNQNSFWAPYIIKENVTLLNLWDPAGVQDFLYRQNYNGAVKNFKDYNGGADKYVITDDCKKEGLFYCSISTETMFYNTSQGNTNTQDGGGGGFIYARLFKGSTVATSVKIGSLGANGFIRPDGTTRHDHWISLPTATYTFSTFVSKGDKLSLDIAAITDFAFITSGIPTYGTYRFASGKAIVLNKAYIY